MVVLLAAVNIIFGFVFGLNIGFVPAFMEFKSRNDNCLNNADETACRGNQHVDCVWHNNSACLFNDLIDCSSYKAQSGCQGESVCYWDYSDGGSCKHESGWQSWQKGFFSGAMLIGAMAGSFLTGKLLDKYGRKRVLGGIGVITLIGAAMMAISRAYDSYGLMIAARIVLGVGVGATCVAAPLYVGEMAPQNRKGSLGVTFQLGITFGIVFVAFLAFLIAPANGNGLQHWETRIQCGLILPCMLFSVLSILLSMIIEESKVWREKNSAGSETEAFIRGEEGDKGWTFDQVRMPLIVAVVLSFATQMTGINAIMNYAPAITKAAGLQPLTGNFIVMLWNFLTSSASIPLANLFERRTMYLGGITLCTLACFLTGIPTFPGVCSDDVTHVLASIGIAVFILAFEIGMGPMFFVLATELFPPSFQELGSSFTNTVQLIFNLIINFLFPIAVEGFSGGVSGNQNKGLAVVFMIFGAIGLVGTLFLGAFLRPYKA